MMKVNSVCDVTVGVVRAVPYSCCHAIQNASIRPEQHTLVMAHAVYTQCVQYTMQQTHKIYNDADAGSIETSSKHATAGWFRLSCETARCIHRVLYSHSITFVIALCMIVV